MLEKVPEQIRRVMNAHGSKCVPFQHLVYKYEIHKENHDVSCRCDRIILYGKGLKQISYGRGESKHSNHRLVYFSFMVEVDMLNISNLKKDFTSWGENFHVEVLLRGTQNSLQTPRIYVRILSTMSYSTIMIAKN